MRLPHAISAALVGLALMAGLVPALGAEAPDKRGAPAQPPPQVAPAEGETATRPARHHADGPPSSGRLRLEGDGFLRIDGRVVVFGLLPEDATIWFRDYEGDARFFLDGEEPPLRDGGAELTKLRGQSGRLYVSGSDLRLQIRSEDISLAAAGRGLFHTMGDGLYQRNDDPLRRWSTDDWPTAGFWLAPELHDQDREKRRANEGRRARS